MLNSYLVRFIVQMYKTCERYQWLGFIDLTTKREQNKITESRSSSLVFFLHGSISKLEMVFPTQLPSHPAGNLRHPYQGRCTFVRRTAGRRTQTWIGRPDKIVRGISRSRTHNQKYTHCGSRQRTGSVGKSVHKVQLYRQATRHGECQRTKGSV